METYLDIIKMWESYDIKTESDLDTYLHNFRILFAYNSGKLENEEITYNDTREIFENGKVSSYTGSPRALFEQQNQKMCYEFLKQKIVSKESISLDLIKETHKILTAGTFDKIRYIEKGERAGEFKKHDYITGLHEVGSTPDKVEEHLLDLIDELDEYLYSVNEPSPDLILTIATYFHARFEHIHPFADGNGRVGRTLLNYFLMINNHPPLIVYEEDRRLYYDCLQEYDTDEKLSPLSKFFIYQLEKTWDKTLENYLGETKTPSKNLSDFIPEL